MTFEQRRDAARARAGGRNTSMTSITGRRRSTDESGPEPPSMPIDPDVPHEGPSEPSGEDITRMEANSAYAMAARRVWDEIFGLQKTIEDLTVSLQPALGIARPVLTGLDQKSEGAIKSAEKPSQLVQELDSMRDNLRELRGRLSNLLSRSEL